MSKSNAAILAEVINRNTVKKTVNKIQLSGNFPEQNAFIEDMSRYIDAQCSRRAGKTSGLAIRFIKTMERHPKSSSLYLSLTQDSAKEIMWPVLLEMNETHKLGCTFTESKMEMKHPNGAKLKLMGADLKNFIKRLKGRKYPAVGIDEAQDFGSHLQSLIDDVLTPSISDYEDGWLAVTGTPGPVPQGYFFEVTQNQRYGFSHHSWTIMSNPHMPNPQEFLTDLKQRREWQDDNPTYKREWLNQWVLDVESLWIRYNEKVNHYQELPSGHEWVYVLGVDIGFNDADALAVLAWSETHDTTFLVEELLTKKQCLTELAGQIKHLQAKYSIGKTVIDEGGLGKKAAEELRRQHGISLEAADKVRKQENVEFLNDALRRGKFKAKSASRFAQDSYLIQVDWDKSTPNRIVIKKKPHSDIIDAVLYAFKEGYAFAHREEPKKPHWGSKEWAEQQSSSMFDAELAGHQAEQENPYISWLKGEK